MDLHGQIMNLPASGEPAGGSMAYKLGHRDARHAAAELASAAEAEWRAQAEANAKDAARYRWLRRYGNGIYRDVWNDDEAITLATVEACASRLDAAIDAAMTAKE